MKGLFFLFCGFFTCSCTIAQTISGKFSALPEQSIRLEGFNGLSTYVIAATQIDAQGIFNLNYTESDYGVGYLIAEDNKPLFIILSGEDIEITGEALSLPENIKVTKGQENQFFEQYANEHPLREQALSAWSYLEKLYTSEPLFTVQKTTFKAIIDEKERINNEDASFLESSSKESYVKWFLPTRKLVSSVSTIAQYRPEEIPEAIRAFRSLDYTDPRLYKSGLFRDAIESHFWLLENSGNPLEKVFEEMKLSIDAILTKLVSNEKIYNELIDYLFDLLEKHSLFEASEYLALSVLNEETCTLNDNLSKQLETYRAMKKGNIAAEVVFDKSNFADQNNSIKKLSDIPSKYTLVVFGASWCPKCREELPEIARHYDKWKLKEVEVVFIGLEEDKSEFLSFSKSFPFPCYSDLKKWESPIAQDYYVFSTPTLFLLDNKREIILRPTSVKQMDAWVDWYLIQGNQ